MKSWYQTGVLAGAASLAILAGTAHAQEVHDSHGIVVGQLLGINNFTLTLNNLDFGAGIVRNPGTRFIYIEPDTSSYYPNQNCTGTRYLLDYGEVPPRAFYEYYGAPGGTDRTFYTYGNIAAAISLSSYWNSYWGVCQNFPAPWTASNASPAVSLGIFYHYEPYCIGTPAVGPCGGKVVE
jgi:hypothetical protein